MSAEKIEPDDAAVAAMKAELEIYEAYRVRAHRNQRWLVPLAMIPAGLVAAIAAMTLLAGGSEAPLGAKDWPQFAFWMLLAVLVLGAGGFLLATTPVRNLQQSLRNRLLPALFGFVGEVEYSHATTPFTFEYIPKGVLPGYARVTFGDVVRGRHRWMRFELFELQLKGGRKNNKTVFDGAVVGFDIPGHFPGLLLATPRTNSFWAMLRDVFATLVTVEAGNPPLDAVYEFRSDNAAAARPLVEGTLGAALVTVGKSWRDGPPRVALSGQIGFLLIPTHKDFFELPSVSVPADYERHIMPMVGELETLLDTALTVRQAMAGREEPGEEKGLLD